MSPLLVGFGLGLFVAAQIGPVSLLIVRSVVRGNFRIGLAMAAGVALVDLGYAALGLAGVARALEATNGAGVALGFIGAGVLAALGVRTMWFGFRARFGLETPEEVGTPRRAFATAFAATALNPLTIALARRRIGPRLLAAIDIGAGTGILGFGAYLGFRTARG